MSSHQKSGNLASVAEARKIILSNARRLGSERVSVDDSLGRVLAEDVVSKTPVPHFRKAAMDGYAVRFRDTREAPARLKITGSVFAGDVPSVRLRRGECVEIATGAMLPEGADAVVMVEYTSKSGNLAIIRRQARRGEHVVSVGSDIRRGARVLKKGLVLAPRHTAVLSSLGLTGISVRRRSRVALISTGNELLRPGQRLSPGKVYGINNQALRHELSVSGAECVDLGLVGDDPAVISRLIRRAVKEADLVLVSGGSSAGREDFMPEVVAGEGHVLLHGVSMKPGKPLLVGKVKSKLVIGVPGHPASALTVFHVFIKPLLAHMAGSSRRSLAVETVLREPFESGGRRMFLPVRLKNLGGVTYATPAFKGSSAITSLGSADGFVEVPPDTTLKRNSKVSVTLM